MGTQSSVLLFVTVTAIVLTYLRFRPRRKALEPPYPPGPTGKTMPTHDPWVQYRKWGEEFGKLAYVQSKNILIINDLQVAIDLLQTRAHIYSDRDTSFKHDLIGRDFILALQRYSTKWRRSRKVFQQSFREATISRFFPAQYRKTHLFLRRMITAPNDFMQHTMALSQGLIYSTLYGLDVEPDDYLGRKTGEIIHEYIDVILLDGAFPILDRFPWLRYMPSWFPGCNFKRITAQCLQRVRETNALPFDIAKSGVGTSLVAELAIQNEENQDEIDAIKVMGFSSTLAGADTTASSLASFLLAMVMHPDVQAKGQEEIDRVIGTDRLPTFEDRRSLPYVESIYREVMRLHPPFPLGISHVSIKDDFYGGYFIPKGCIVVPNLWAMNRDPDMYPEPDKFLPERFLNSPEGPFFSINKISAFGFGRRACVGRYMADNTVWLCIASTLAMLKVVKAKDDKGIEIPISGEYTHNFLRHPKPYQCSIVPRSLYAKELVLATAEFQ
ncbi:hypothetical protein GYMLUDRAFT_249860 [Collybiopsis luxurians FD-317 M1]|uniref:Cytochrome P450 n=1 Tax=Collybiopsis luxurians FD-317 M1 TaxID=944289 RepID=A0A0D0BH75_9AGAR|nr:hypothetical protein GYMLUDRAFT_249860 [Collybiopsis luxurians FD-317 M1]